MNIYSERIRRIRKIGIQNCQTWFAALSAASMRASATLCAMTEEFGGQVLEVLLSFQIGWITARFSWTHHNETTWQFRRQRNECGSLCAMLMMMQALFSLFSFWFWFELCHCRSLFECVCVSVLTRPTVIPAFVLIDWRGALHLLLFFLSHCNVIIEILSKTQQISCHK